MGTTRITAAPLRRFTALMLICAGGSLPAIAQVTGQIRGRVTAGSGTPLAAASVVVRNDAAGTPAQSAVTDPRGTFNFQGLPAGDGYVLTVSCPGYSRLVLSEIRVDAGKVMTIPVVLQDDAALREEVRVLARPPIVSLQETTTETRVSDEFISGLPILGRDYQDVLTLAPGVTDIDGDGNPNIHGARDTSVITLVDGVSTNDPLTGRNGMQLNIESIQEIEVKTSGATAEFGRAQGGFANIITKSGGNDFAGAFKFFWRGQALDGDGAGGDPPGLHAGLGESGLRELEFNDYLPFLSLEGPLRPDHAWFYFTHETVHREEPVNTVSTAFLRGVRQSRDFLKLTWQVTPNTRLALSGTRDPQEYLNEGLNSFTRVESGYIDRQGGVLISLKGTSVLSPQAALETTVSFFDGRPALVPTLEPDTNHNGVLFIDHDFNGIFEASERDPGVDYDGDGRFDVYEDTDEDHVLDSGEDRDGDGRLTPWSSKGGGACEGATREDTDCDGVRDPGEDRNGNGILDDTPFPLTDYPYGSLSPLPGDRDYTIDRLTRITSGPYYEEYSDSRERAGFRQDLSLFATGARASHDLRTGLIIEREDFDRRTFQRPIAAVRDFPECAKCRIADGNSGFDRADARIDTAIVLMPAETTSRNAATGSTLGIYVQDSWRPVPNVSVGLGLRFEREAADASGYSSFDPATEETAFKNLARLTGYEARGGDLRGNYDGVVSLGILDDPIFWGYADPMRAIAPILDPLRTAAVARLTRHHTEVAFSGGPLRSLFPEIVRGDKIDPSILVVHGILPQLPEKFAITNHNLAPRLALSWDPWADGRTKVFATWGRYFDRLFLSTVVAEEGPDRLSRYYLLDPYGWDGAPNHHLGRVLAQSAPSTTQVERGLETPFTDEFTAGIEREIAPETAISATFVSRRFRRQLQDVDINHELRFDPATGRPLDILGESSCRLAGTVVCDGRVADGLPDLYLHNPFFNEVLRIGNFNEARYKAIELEIVRRLSRLWELRGSYTYSRATGAAEDFQSRLGNDPSIVESEFGYLDYDQRHVVKAFASLFLPRDWRLGLSATWGSGLPYSIVTRSFQLDDADYPQYRTRYGAPTSALGTAIDSGFVSYRRNSERNPAAYDFNFRLEKVFVIGRTSAAWSVEVFNLLNSDSLRIFKYEPVPPDLLTEDDATPIGHLAVDAERRFGRRFQVGIQIEF